MHATTLVSNEQHPNGLTPAGCLSAGTGDLLPTVTLPTPNGAHIALDQYSARRNLVVVLLGAGAEDESVSHLLTALTESRAAIAGEEADVLLVRSGNASEWPDPGSHPFPVLVDEDATFHQRVGSVDAAGRAAAAVGITDRFREIYHVALPIDAEWPPTARDVLGWLVFMNIQCPECGAPEW